MKRAFAIIFFIASYTSTIAQLTLTRNDFPAGGDHIIWLVCPDTMHTEGLTGSNVTWDLSTLNIQYSPVPPMLNYSQNSTNLIGSINYGMQFEYFEYSIDTLTFSQIGYSHSNVGPGGSSNGISYDSDYVKKMIFPFTYLNYFTDSFNYDKWYNPNMLPSYHIYGWGFDSTICDGWGTLILPHGIYNALRVYSYHVTNDTDNNGGYIQKISNSYAWYTNNHKCPLLVCNVGNNGIRQFTAYTDSNTPIGLNENSIENHQVICRYAGIRGKYKIEIKDIALRHTPNSIISDLYGRTVSKALKQVSNNEYEIDISEFAEGIYYLTLSDVGFNVTIKLINL